MVDELHVILHAKLQLTGRPRSTWQQPRPK